MCFSFSLPNFRTKSKQRNMGFEIPSKNIPVIDFNSENLKPGSSSWISTSHHVRKTLEIHGCFIAAHRKCPQELHDKMFDLAKELLFELPVEIKEKNISECCGFGYGANFPKMPLIEYLGITHGGTVEATKDFTHLLWPAGNNDFLFVNFSLSLSFPLHYYLLLINLKYNSNDFGTVKRQWSSRRYNRN